MLDPRGTKRNMWRVAGLKSSYSSQGDGRKVCTGKKGSKQVRDAQEFPRRPKVRPFQVHGTAGAKGLEVETDDVHESTWLARGQREGKNEPRVSVRGWGREGRRHVGHGQMIRGWGTCCGEASLSKTEVTCSDFYSENSEGG